MTPTYGTCAYCGTFGPLAAATYADAPSDACMTCAVVIVAERSVDLAVLFVGDVTMIGTVPTVGVAALN